QFFWQRKVPRKEDAHASVASGIQDFENLLRDPLRVFDLTQNSNLHIVYEQRDPTGVTNLFKRLWDLNAVSSSHVREISRPGLGEAKCVQAGSSRYFENLDLLGNAAE